MTEIKNLISICNTYYQEKNKSKYTPNSDLLRGIAEYITNLMQVFGVYPNLNPLIGSGSTLSGVNKEETILPFVTALSKFRDTVRNLAQSKSDPREFLILCDQLRDFDMVDLGISLEDRDDGKALIKLIDASILLEARKEKEKV